ncbi:MAG: bifunctional demethylmenaquinone methyltransferase/2-methoxy-6-polyprenyl-1,4-benzoquinol methylase UbiE [Bacteroidaceae bacterium]|nr:bifunctional demethylmenaquinone methyltransferase/2-methoxy-6-polyprenyl-1,4-benzoquinol methylase UbiE [Bacteroidaceae bacterium]
MGYKHEEVKPYDTAGEKREQIEEMFNNIAPEYDKYNYAVSLSIDRIWRKRAIFCLKKHNPKQVLDIATGTGDLAILINKVIKPESIIGCDISEGMMAVARRKCEKRGFTNIKFEKEDCTALSYPDNSFDAVTVSFGIRNFQHLEKSLCEMCRVLRPKGHVVILELSAPLKFPMKQLFHIYAKYVMPAVGKLISKDKKAYEYLPESIAAFPQGEVMKGVLEKCGFTNVVVRRFTCGLCTFYIAEK